MLKRKTETGLLTLLSPAVTAAACVTHLLVGFGQDVAIPETIVGLLAPTQVMCAGLKTMREASRSVD